MSIQERLQLVLKMHNLTPSSFADQIGVQRSNISHVLSGRNKPSLDFLEKIVLTYPRVNAHWLITGVVPQKEVEQESQVNQDESREGCQAEFIDPKKKEVIDRIVFFYSDGTFETSYPRASEKD